MKQVLTDDVLEGDPFHSIREKAFILCVDLPAGAMIRLQILDPAGTWRDISEGSGIRFEGADFNDAAADSGSMKFFYAVPGASYRLVSSFIGAVAWLMYNEIVPGLTE